MRAAGEHADSGAAAPRRLGFRLSVAKSYKFIIDPLRFRGGVPRRALTGARIVGRGLLGRAARKDGYYRKLENGNIGRSPN